MKLLKAIGFGFLVAIIMSGMIMVLVLGEEWWAIFCAMHSFSDEAFATPMLGLLAGAIAAFVFLIN